MKKIVYLMPCEPENIDMLLTSLISNSLELKPSNEI